MDKRLRPGTKKRIRRKLGLSTDEVISEILTNADDETKKPFFASPGRSWEGLESRGVANKWMHTCLKAFAQYCRKKGFSDSILTPDDFVEIEDATVTMTTNSDQLDNVDLALQRFQSTKRSAAEAANSKIARQLKGELIAPTPSTDPIESLLFNRRFQLPNNLHDFVGREVELNQLQQRLTDSSCVEISALKGMGGVGKTTLAVRVAYAVMDRFPDAQLFIDLQGVALRPVTPYEAMARIVLDLHPTTVDLPKCEFDLLHLYRSTLRGKRALIVLDNASDEGQVKNLLTGDMTGFIITSRRSLIIDGVTMVPVDTLPSRDSLRLLRHIIGAKGTESELHMVAELCDHLPLALRVAGDFIRIRVGWKVCDYIDALNEERLRWMKIGLDPQKDVEAVLKLSSAQLAREDMDLATRWHILADLPSDFSEQAAAAAWDMKLDRHRVLEDLSKLVDRSLLMVDENSLRYRMHDLMKPIAAGLFQ